MTLEHKWEMERIFKSIIYKLINRTHIYKKTVTKKPRDYAALSFNPNG